MTCTQCKEKEVSNPKLTGELCTSCFFKNKSSSFNPDSNQPDSSIVNQVAQDAESNESNEKEKLPIISQKKIQSKIDIPEDGKKYCQSCIERYGTLNLATREWKEDYFICDNCFAPLIESMVNYDATRTEIEAIKTEVNYDSPALNQIYDILGVPEPLRFSKTDDVLKNRNEIFNHHATAIVNQDLDSVKERIEFLQVLLFQIKIELEPETAYINKIKAESRKNAGLTGIEKSKSSIKGPSKVKQSKLEKEAKALGMTTEAYSELIKNAKKKEFEKIIGS